MIHEMQWVIACTYYPCSVVGSAAGTIAMHGPALGQCDKRYDTAILVI
jgi:hypothetical protein